MKEKEKVRQIISENFENPDISSINEHEVGASHQTYFVSLEDRELVVKISDHDWEELPDIEQGFKIEAPVMRKVRRETELPIPKVYRFENPSTKSEPGYIISERIEGKSLEKFLSYTENRDLYRQIGRNLGELHNKIKFKNHGKLEYKPEKGRIEVEEREWKSIFRSIAWKFIKNMEETEFKDLKSEMRALIEENLKILEERTESALIHAEMSPWNMIGTENEIKAIIDWERSFSGDPEYDLFVAERLLCIKGPHSGKLHQKEEEIMETLYSGYREKRDLDREWRKRRTLYRISNLAHQMWLIEGEEAEKNLRKRWKNLKQEIK